MLELLQAAATAATPEGGGTYPDGVLQFTLDYGTRPDIAVERQRIANLLGGDSFDLFPYSLEDDPALLILQFGGIEIQQSPDFLFQEAQTLREALDIPSVTPETEPPFRDAASAPEAEGVVKDIFWERCRSQDPVPADPDWARKLMRADTAVARFGVSGAGVVVGQPDTGVADHRELAQGLDKARGNNFLEAGTDPTDPLSAGMASPGHGTGTSSVVISRPAHVVTGSAPGATLVPIRATNAVVIGTGVRVGKSIDHARHNGCAVVTMSLGGVQLGRALSGAVVRAVKAHMIVLAAAGNCVRMVTYPAWDRNVIAVAAVNHHRRLWRGSCRGAAVDIAAPGENVTVARRKPGESSHSDVSRDGQGTSYAVALTAGVAALWLERHGRANVIAAARTRGVYAQHLFRAALKQTAQPGVDWDHGTMGAGIVDAEALLALPLDQIDVSRGIPTEGNPAIAAFGSSFEGGPFAAEASYLGADWALREDPVAARVIERPMAARPSAQFAAVTAAEPPKDLPVPAVLATPATPPLPIDEALRGLAAGRRGNLESAAEVAHDTALEAVRAEGVANILDTARSALDQKRSLAADRVDRAVQNEAVDRFEQALRTLLDPDRAGAMSAAETRVTLEALVRLTGRPTIRVRRDGTELADPLIGQWANALIPTRNKWQRLTDAVGRIDIEVSPGNWVHAGTGFLLAEGHVMTNRHVLDTFAEPLPAPGGQQTFLMRNRASIIFDPDAADEATRFEIAGIVTAGGRRIGRFVDLDKLDMAVLAMTPDNGVKPPPKPIDRQSVSVSDPDVTRILVAGYPAEPNRGSGPDPQADYAKYLEFWDRIGELYGDDYGVKYISPGRVLDRPGTVASDPKGWAFTHDATTLPGNSGSAIISLEARMQFCGLHFGGEVLTQNLAHDIETVFAGGDGVFSTAFLTGGGG